MSKIVSLSQARKTQTRAEKRAQADANATRYGRTKAERELDAARKTKPAHDLDQHKRE